MATDPKSSLSANNPRGWPVLPWRHTLIMGVLNLTPDSFSDGGKISGVEAAAVSVAAMIGDGADIIDIGGESTHPSAVPIDAADEIARVLPAVRHITASFGLPVSIDTYKAKTAAAALEAGASIVNDVWGLQKDPDMARVVAEHGAGVCIMHNRQTVDPGLDILADIAGFFSRSLELAFRAGIRQEHIVLDPGIGFGKSFDQNLICLQRLAALKHLGFPLLVGCSRKGFIGAVSGRKTPAERLFGSIASHVVAALNGAAIIRAHDIQPHREALALTDAVIRGSVAVQETHS